ncbi:MAG: acyl-ACP--UDP-N-acetylglucosamine O-acyltransferase [Bdellovibrionales bacterium]|nr:acyl-ACP--UDP-N-acetylglucosamine O-acyltransferase [Bdellovibrionales bacterium]
MTESGIHPTAVVSDGAVIGVGTEIGPFSVIGPHVVIGANNRIGSHVVIEGHTTIGDENQIFQFASVGAQPQDLKYSGEPSTLTIGNKNRIREYVTLQPGTKGGGMKTVIGSENLFMATVHVGHDCIVGSGNIFANGVALAGHVVVGDYILLGGLSGVHQFVRLGDHAMLGAGSMVAQDIPPFCVAQGDRAALVGIHQIGLSRRGFADEQIAELKQAFRALFVKSGGTFKERLQTLKANTNAGELVSRLVEFIESSERGIAPSRK